MTLPQRGKDLVSKLDPGILTVHEVTIDHQLCSRQFRLWNYLILVYIIDLDKFEQIIFRGMVYLLSVEERNRG